MDAAELRQKNIDELQSELIALLREYFNLRMQRIPNQEFKKPHQFKIVRRNIARVKTVLNEKTRTRKKA